MPPRPPRSPLFPYTTLFRSRQAEEREDHQRHLRLRRCSAALPHVEGAGAGLLAGMDHHGRWLDRKSTRLNSSHLVISYAVFCLKKKIKKCTPKYTKTRTVKY